ncbi:hypothetical protein FOZ63_010624, partial [Perkinsus olseni]
YSPEAVARGVWWKDIAAWCDSSLGSEFYAESSVTEPRLVFTHHEGCTDGRSAPVNGSDDVQQKDTEEKTSEEDKEVEHLEEEEAEVVQDDLSEKTKAWGLLLRIAILYVGQCPSDGNNLREVKNDWLKVKQDKDKTFETYAAEERQAYEKMQVMYQWSGVECPTEYERIIKFMKGLNSGLADAYSKKLRKQDRRAEELTYRSMPSLSDDNRSSKQRHQSRQRHWCKYCQKEVFHSIENCW